ncbi:phosphotransferase enzyme family protein [Psychrobium sp. nBUS_13]|uniref:phosphotransferase enzyme family protein n=1 Tax=Psychrobium sp. nBUS_13 TaxID=3395319 RepID=UPI003EBDD508
MNQSSYVAIVSRYVKDADCATVTPLGNGLVNLTLMVTTSTSKFVLQRINHHVFPNPQAVVENSAVISSHLLAKETNYQYAVTTPRASLNGNLLEVIDNEYWRALEYVEDTITVDAISDVQQAYDTAFSFAKFSGALASLSANSLQPIIERFHDLSWRLSQLEAAKKSASTQRLNRAKPVIDAFESQREFVAQVTQLVKQLPLRITHNDTKINNLLFNQATKLPHAVIDLDTCMPGYLMHDFGDMVRTCCGSLAEDATNIEEMAFQADIYQQLMAGYIEGLAGIATAIEVDSLTIGARLMPFIIGSRFLTDYLANDVYFATTRENHNLDRAANQFRLFELATDFVASTENAQQVVG